MSRPEDLAPIDDLVRDESEITRAQAEQHYTDLKASIDKLTPQLTSEAEPLIHTLPTQQEIEGRTEECTTILRTLAASKEHVVTFAAPGGFGKTALLAKVVQQLSSDGKSLREQVMLPDGETIQTNIGALLYVDCRDDIKPAALFANAGRLVGQEQAFQEIYNSNTSLSDKLQEIFSRLSKNNQKRVWFLFDNFEPFLNEKGEIATTELREFFSAIFAGQHSVYALIVGREAPRFSPREQVLELAAVGNNLFDGLPLHYCLTYLRKCGATQGLSGSPEDIDAVLKEFALRVHRIPLALVWAVGYLRDTNYSLKDVLQKAELFEDFDNEQARDADRYESKGLKRLHYEQLNIQSSDSVPILRLLALFKRAVPKGALAHLMSEVELNRKLTRLERNKLISREESDDAYTRVRKDELSLNLYALHPVICENDFFEAFTDKESFYGAAASNCWHRIAIALQIKHSTYALELAECGLRLYGKLSEDFQKLGMFVNFASMLIQKGMALDDLGRLPQAIIEYEKAISILEQLVEITQQSDLAVPLAAGHLNKGAALRRLHRLQEALDQYEKSIAFLKKLVKADAQPKFANELATAYQNKAVALDELDRKSEAIAEFDKSIEIRERLVNVEQQLHLANDLAMIYTNKGLLLIGLEKMPEAIVEFDKAIEIRERLVNVEQQLHVESDLAITYGNKGFALSALNKVAESIIQVDKAIAIHERLVHDEQQRHHANTLGSWYLNKAISLEICKSWDAALVCYGQALKEFDYCLQQLEMFWIVAEVLKTLRYRLTILINAKHWTPAAADISTFLSFYLSYAATENCDKAIKEASEKELGFLTMTLTELTPEELNLLKAELGDEVSLSLFVEPDSE